MDKKIATRLRQQYPNHVPVRIAAPLLGVSERQLAKLIAEGREPFAGIGANIGTKQRYVRIYTERLIAYLSGESLYGQADDGYSFLQNRSHQGESV